MKNIYFIAIFVSLLIFNQNAFAASEPSISGYTLNGEAADVSVNPKTNKENIVSISINVDRAIKLTRVYFCSENVALDKCTSDYTKYVSPDTEGSIVTAEWNGYKKGNSGPADIGRYWLRVLLKEGDNSSVSINLTNYWINIGEVVDDKDSGDEDGEDTDTSTTTSTTTTSKTTTSDSTYSTHSSQADVSSIDNVAPEIGIGRERYVSVGTPVNFEVWIKKGSVSGTYDWSFGDGSSAKGDKVSHPYKFPGTYNVVANGQFSNSLQSVARTKVVVSKPEIVIKKIDSVLGLLELENKDSREVNIGGWELRTKDGAFKFPVDTIIEAKGTLPLSLELLGLATASDGKYFLVFPDERLVSLYEDTVLPILTVGTSSAYISDSDRKLLVELTRQLVEARTKLSSVANPVSDRPQAVRENLQTASSVSASVQYVQAETVATSSSVEVTNQIAGVKDIGDTIILGESKKDLKSSGGINWLKKLFGF